MAKKTDWRFSSYDDLLFKWNSGEFTCDDIADLKDPLVLDWCARLEDWAPKIALCFNRKTSSVTLDRMSQHEMPELRRLVCFHPNCSMETLERLTADFDNITVDSACQQINKMGGYKAPTTSRSMAPRKAASRKGRSTRRARSRRATVRR